MRIFKIFVVAVIRSCFRFIGFVSLLWTLSKAWTQLQAADNIALYPHGGFGHTLIAPDWIRRLFPEDQNVIVFGSWQGRHNLSIPLIWNGGLILIPFVSSFIGINVGDGLAEEKLFKTMCRLMRWLWPEKRILYYIEDMMAKSPRPDFVAEDEFFATRMECYYYHQVVNNPVLKPQLPTKFVNSINKQLQALCAEKKLLTCNLYLRGKGQNLEDKSDTNRNSSGIGEYLPAICFLVSQGYQVLLTGDVSLSQNLREEFSGCLVDWNDVSCNKDIYQIYAGLYTDIHIGSFSGGSAYSHVADIPSLMVDVFAFGEALPFSTVHYKRLRAADGRLVSPTVLMTDFTFDYICEGYEIIDNSAGEILNAVKDWLPHANSRKSYGVNVKELGISCPWVEVSDARISPVWLEGFKEAV